MFGIGMTELIIILVIALLVIGPDKLPDLAKTLGKGMAEFKRAAEDFRDNIHSDMRAEEEKKKLLNITKEKDGAKKTGTADVATGEKGDTQAAVQSEIEQVPIADEIPPSEDKREKKSADIES